MPDTNYSYENETNQMADQASELAKAGQGYDQRHRQNG